MNARLVAALLLSAICVAGCAAMPSPARLEGAPRPFVLEEALSGRMAGRGVITPIIGAATTFDVRIDGSWDGKVLTLVEDFRYASGAVERKTWRLTRTPAGDYTGTREDVIGRAHAYRDGAALRLDYTVALDTPLGRSARFQDVLYWENGRTIRNRAIASKFGLRLARVDLQLSRSD